MSVGSDVSKQERLAGAIWGQLAGDAAALGTHWIYDLTELARRYPTVEGFEAPAAGHYHAGKMPGAQTHYGDGALCLLASVAEAGRFDAADFGRRFAATFGEGYAGYRDHATRETLANLAAGGDPAVSGAADDQLATASRLASVVVRHHAATDLLSIVDALTQVTQRHPTALAVNRANAVILRALLGGATALEALAEALASPEVPLEAKRLLEAGRTRAGEETVAATLALGQSCPLPKSFPAAVQALCRHEESYRDGILATVRAGGDNAGRAAMLGAWLGARHGVAGIPAGWRERLLARDTIARHVEAIIAATSSS